MYKSNQISLHRTSKIDCSEPKTSHEKNVNGSKVSHSISAQPLFIKIFIRAIKPSKNSILVRVKANCRKTQKLSQVLADATLKGFFIYGTIAPFRLIL